MDYNLVENLALQAKDGDIKAKELLAQQFTPFILNISKRSFINSYEFSDIKNECYRILFKCVSMYNPDNHRFVAYASNGIKNSVNHLIRRSIKRSGSEGSEAYIFESSLENILYSDIEHIEDFILAEEYRSKLSFAMKSLEAHEQDLIAYVYFQGHSLKKYSELKGIPYHTAFNRKNRILKKLKNKLDIKGNPYYLN
jgi:RNA polymerase sigma factor (sigma-70 family)